MAAKDDEDERIRSVAVENATSVMAARQRAEGELRKQTEWLRITLSSIGDAVISTDAEGRVTFLNAVAEKLTGWTATEAMGQSLPAVFHIVNEHTRQPVENPALRALQEGTIVGLANHTVLIARDGTERPIDDSAAPLRDGSGAPMGAVLVFRDVSDRKRAEDTQARLAAIVESSDDAIVSKTLDGIIRSWNLGAERLFGYSPQEAIGQPITLIIPSDRQDEEKLIVERLRRGERIDHFETVRISKDGRFHDISLTVSPMRDSEGHIVGASKVARDITDRKAAERVIRASEARHRFLAGLVAATQGLTEPDDVMALTAKMLAEHLQVDRCAYAEVEDEEVFVITGDYSRGVPSIVGRWPLAAFGAELERLMRANETYVIDDVDNDERVGIDLTAYRQTNIQAVICVPLHKSGKLAAAMAVHQKTPRHWAPEEIDLVRTVVARSWESIERTRVARGLQQTAERLALALAAASLGDWSWDAATDVVTLSERAAQVLGVPADADITWAQLQKSLHEEDRQRARRAVEQAVADRGLYDIEYRVIHPAGKELWISAKGRAHYDDAGRPKGMFGVLQDVTDRKHLEQTLQERADALMESDRKKDEFIALLAHELRNPLAPLRNGLQVLRLDADAAAVAQARSMMERQLEHMVRLIDDLLDVSRIGQNKMELRRSRVLLTDVVSSAVETARPSIEAAEHELIVSLPPEPVYLDADLTRLAQVFSNLLTNSAKYTEKKGRIWLSAEQHNEDVIVSVRDTGIGIPADALPRIFGMFSQVDRSIERTTGGLGIGLALVKGLIEMHEGTVSAASAGQGKGSTFTVKLPALRGRAEPASIAPSDDEQAAPGPRRRILVVDDNRDSAISMAVMLKLRGNEVRTAHDGLEAVEAAEQFRPQVILMDVGMPRLNGLDASRRIREKPWGKDISIIALTGWGQDADRAQSREAGCDGHLVKPVNLHDLERQIKDAAKQQ